MEFPGGPLSDIIRFNPAGTGGPAYPASLVFYSDQDGGVESLAGTRFPTAPYANTLTLTEVNGGVVYTPLAGQPGFVSGFSVTYHGISDVPEPSTWILMGTGLVGLLGYRWRRREKAVSS